MTRKAYNVFHDKENSKYKLVNYIVADCTINFSHALSMVARQFAWSVTFSRQFRAFLMKDECTNEDNAIYGHPSQS